MIPLLKVLIFRGGCVQVVMKQAQTVAQAVVRRPSFGGWSCMGPRRRNVVSTTICESNEEGSIASAVATDKVKVDQCVEVADEKISSSLDATATDVVDGSQQLAGELTFMIRFFIAILSSIKISITFLC